MNTYTIVFKTRFSGSEHRWVIKETATNKVVNYSIWFKSRDAMYANLVSVLTWMKTAPQE